MRSTSSEAGNVSTEGDMSHYGVGWWKKDKRSGCKNDLLKTSFGKLVVSTSNNIEVHKKHLQISNQSRVSYAG